MKYYLILVLSCMCVVSSCGQHTSKKKESSIISPEEECFVIDTIRIMDNINSLAEAIAPFRGKKVYVDVWATWCKGCIMEFDYKDELQKWLNENNCEILYISLDGDQFVEKWEKLIRERDLKGTHINFTPELATDLRRIAESEMFVLPWYMLIDENGEIEVKHMKKPSEIVAERL